MKKIKKSKPKRKWSKQVGYFLFKHPVSQISGSIFIDVYFKDEFIGIISSINQKSKKNKVYHLGIYDFSKTRNATGTAIGVVECYGMSHGLPKTIIKAEIQGEFSVLVLPRNVLVEKYPLLTWKAINERNIITGNTAIWRV